VNKNLIYYKISFFKFLVNVDGWFKKRYDEITSGWLGVRGLFDRSRKVRTPQGTTSANYRGGELPQGINLPDEDHRNRLPGSLSQVKVKRWCKRPPAFLVIRTAR